MKVMVTFYESKGATDKDAFNAGVADLAGFVEKTYGALESPPIKDKDAKALSLSAAYWKDESTAADPMRIQFKPRTNPAEFFTYASLTHFRAQQFRAAVLYFQPRKP